MRYGQQDVSRERSFRAPRGIAPMVLTAENVRRYARLADIGIDIPDRQLQQMIDGLSFGMDSNDVGIYPTPGTPANPVGSAAVPVQFLQTWLPGFVAYLTTPRMIDELLGISTIGKWHDAQIVQQTMEPVGTAQPYGDYNNVPLASWTPTFDIRSVVRYEMGLLVGVLEEARTSEMNNTQSAAIKRTMAGVALEIQRNRVGFYGYNDGSGKTFGFLNDPNLPAYVTAPNGASGSPLWSGKTYLEINRDFRMGFAGLQNQSGGIINPKKAAITVAIPLSVDQFTTVTPDFGNSVQDWLDKSYGNVRVIAIPELNDANGGASAMYFFAESVQDGSSTDDGRTFTQMVPTKFMPLGVERRSKSYIEDYTNATAGVMLKRPYAVYRLTGI